MIFNAVSVDYGKKSKFSFTARADMMAEAPSRVREAPLHGRCDGIDSECLLWCALKCSLMRLF